MTATVQTRAAYPAYKDSGVTWLGDVPAHWDVKRLKYAAVPEHGTISVF